MAADIVYTTGRYAINNRALVVETGEFILKDDGGGYSPETGYGKVFINTKNLYFLDEDGLTYQLTGSTTLPHGIEWGNTSLDIKSESGPIVGSSPYSAGAGTYAFDISTSGSSGIRLHSKTASGYINFISEGDFNLAVTDSAQMTFAEGTITASNVLSLYSSYSPGAGTSVAKFGTTGATGDTEIYTTGAGADLLLRTLGGGDISVSTSADLTLASVTCNINTGTLTVSATNSISLKTDAEHLTIASNGNVTVDTSGVISIVSDVSNALLLTPAIKIQTTGSLKSNILIDSALKLDIQAKNLTFALTDPTTPDVLCTMTSGSTVSFTGHKYSVNHTGQIILTTTYTAMGYDHIAISAAGFSSKVLINSLYASVSLKAGNYVSITANNFRMDLNSNAYVSGSSLGAWITTGVSYSLTTSEQIKLISTDHVSGISIYTTGALIGNIYIKATNVLQQYGASISDNAYTWYGLTTGSPLTVRMQVDNVGNVSYTCYNFTADASNGVFYFYSAHSGSSADAFYVYANGDTDSTIHLRTRVGARNNLTLTAGADAIVSSTSALYLNSGTTLYGSADTNVIFTVGERFTVTADSDSGTLAGIHLETSNSSNVGIYLESASDIYLDANSEIFLQTGSTPTTRFYIDSTGLIATGGETAPDVGVGGICLYQGAVDVNILTMKSSDVDHPFTGADQADTYASFRKFIGAYGGLAIRGYNDYNSTTAAYKPSMFIGGFSKTPDTTTSNVGYGNIVLWAGKEGTLGNATALASTENLLVIQNNSTNTLLQKGNGDTYIGGMLSTGGEYAPDVVSGGLCLNTGSTIGNIVTFKRSNVSHSFTEAESDTIGEIQYCTNGYGGISLYGYMTTSTAYQSAIRLWGYVPTPDTSNSSSTEGIIRFLTYAKNGSSTITPTAEHCIFSVGAGASARFIIKGDGQVYNDYATTMTLYDTYDDVSLVRAVQLGITEENRIRVPKEAIEVLHSLGIMQGSFVSMQKLNALLMGSVVQLWNTIRGMGRDLNFTDEQLIQYARKYED